MVVLITGSETPTELMIKKAREVVLMCLKRNHEILCGDLVGIEQEVVRYANLREYEKITVWGANGRLAYGTYCGVNKLTGAAPPMRDMIMARNCDVCIAIVDTESTTALITCGHAK